MKKLYILFSIFLYVSLSYSQDIVWQKLLGGKGFDEPQSIFVDSNSIILAGMTSSKLGIFKSNNKFQDGFVMKLNMKGEIEWTIVQGTDGGDFIHKIIKTKDDCFLTCGTSDNKIWLLKIDQAGKIRKNIVLKGNRTANSLVEDNKGNIYIVGTSYVNYDKKKNDLAVIKLDENLNVIWNKFYGGSDIDWGRDILSINNEIIIIGRTNSNNGDVSNHIKSSDIWLLKLDDKGNLIWDKCLGTNNYDKGEALVKVNEKEFILIGSIKTIEEKENVFTAKYNIEGKLLWEKRIGGVNSDFGISATMDRLNIYVYSISYSNPNSNGKSDINIIKLNPKGEVLSSYFYGGEGGDGSFDCPSCLFFYNGLYFIGSTYSNDNWFNKNEGEQDIWIVKTRK